MRPEPNFLREARTYLIGFVLALVLTIIPFALVAWSGWTGGGMLIFIGILAVIQIIVHFRFFLHIDLTRQKREDLQLILFSSLILLIMGIGTVWIMGNLYTRMH
ncbi:MAG: cytochrome o ubiquinol oxidase subunit IV [Pseudomonadota bacterium]